MFNVSNFTDIQIFAWIMILVNFIIATLIYYTHYNLVIYLMNLSVLIPFIYMVYKADVFINISGTPYGVLLLSGFIIGFCEKYGSRLYVIMVGLSIICNLISLISPDNDKIIFREMLYTIGISMFLHSMILWLGIQMKKL